MPNYDESIVFIEREAYRIPGWLDGQETATDLPEIMWGHFGFTLNAIITLYKFHRTRNYGSYRDRLCGIEDQAHLLSEIALAIIEGYSTYYICKAIYEAASAWQSVRQSFSERFVHKLDEMKFQLPSIKSFDFGRSDAVFSGSFLGLPGCVPEHLLHAQDEFNHFIHTPV